MDNRQSLALIMAAAGLIVGCAQGRHSTEEGQVTLAPYEADRAGDGQPRAGVTPEQTQDAFRRELLVNQLRQSQMDLQQVTSEAQRRSVQERIALIEQQLHALGGPPANIDLNALARQSQGRVATQDDVARRALYAAGQPVSTMPTGLSPQARDPQDAAAEQAVGLLVQSQWSGADRQAAAGHAQLSQLQLDLQMATDDATKDALAREIAELRMRLAEAEGR